MSIWVIIPVKPLKRAKSRLADVLSQEQREVFAVKSLLRLIETVKSVPAVAGVLVISRDTKALALARDAGAHTVQESGAPELNNALMRATLVVGDWRANSVLVLPADLPLITAEDITEIIRLGSRLNTIVIATDRNENGTNALMSTPPGLIPYSYGEGSFLRHIQLAQEAGVRVEIYHSDRLLDVDIPADLEVYLQNINPNTESLISPVESGA